MNGLFILWAILAAAIVTLVVVRVTKWHELLIIGGCGFLTGYLGWSEIGDQIGRVWHSIF